MNCFFVLGFVKIIVQNRLLFSIKPKNIRSLSWLILLLKFQQYLALISLNIWNFTFYKLTNTSVGKQLTPRLIPK